MSKKAARDTPRIDKSIWCVAHRIHLVIGSLTKQDRSPLFQQLRKRITNTVGHFNHLSRKTMQLYKKAQELGLKKKKIIQKYETRWNSDFHQLKSIVELWPGMVKMLGTNWNWQKHHYRQQFPRNKKLMI